MIVGLDNPSVPLFENTIVRICFSRAECMPYCDFNSKDNGRKFSKWEIPSILYWSESTISWNCFCNIPECETNPYYRPFSVTQIVTLGKPRRKRYCFRDHAEMSCRVWKPAYSIIRHNHGFTNELSHFSGCRPNRSPQSTLPSLLVVWKYSWPDKKVNSLWNTTKRLHIHRLDCKCLFWQVSWLCSGEPLPSPKCQPQKFAWTAKS